MAKQKNTVYVFIHVSVPPQRNSQRSINNETNDDGNKMSAFQNVIAISL